MQLQAGIRSQNKYTVDKVIGANSDYLELELSDIAYLMYSSLIHLFSYNKSI